MTNTITRTSVVALCFTLAIASSTTAADFCWTGDESTIWGDERNWDNCDGQPVQSVPGKFDTAIIKADAANICEVLSIGRPKIGTLIVEDDDMVLLSIGGATGVTVTLSVMDHMEVAGTIQIMPTCTLELNGTTTSTVDGTVEFYYVWQVGQGGTCDSDPHGTLQIRANMTIEGSGGQIVGRKCTGPGARTRGIIATDLGKRLTVKTSPSSAKFCVRGYLDVKALMTNESARVGTDANDDIMLLSINDKDGDGGDWFCSAGELHVQGGVAITGKNRWDMSQASGSAELHFESGSECTCLEGDFDIYDGKVFLKDDVCTTGTARVKSVLVAVPRIVVSANKDGNFGGTCAGCGF